jgi:hydroxyacylglutathione hydrolase
MPIDIVTVPCLADNYAYLVRDGETGRVTLIDAPEAAPVAAALEARGWPLHEILITHHHHDHTDGVAGLLARYPARVTGPAAEADRLPPLDRAVADGDEGGNGAGSWRVIAVPGHTLGHVAYHFPLAGAVFTADSLMALGCGRVFEGTPAQMWHSLSRLAALPPGTTVHSGHEYTASNARFALTIEPGNPALTSRAEQVSQTRAKGLPTVPARLADELATNPFLRAGRPELRRALGMDKATDAEVFAEIRARKDRF